MRSTALLLMALPAFLLLAACGAGKGAAPAAAAAAAGGKPAATEVEAQAAPGMPVTLDAEQARKLGVKLQPAAAATYREEREGFGQVWSHEAIAQVVADVASAAAAANQSAAALARIHKLADSPGAFPADAVETAQRQASLDETALQLAERKRSALLGDRLPFKVPGAELSGLASGQAKLVRVTFPLGAGPHQTPRELRLLGLNNAAGAKGWKARAVWDAPADANVPGYSFWAIASGEGLLEGDRLLARAPDGDAQPGALVPDAAVVVSDDKYWCLVAQPPGTYRRVEIDTRRPVDAGYIVNHGVAAGDRLVVHGAGLLLARMMGSGADSEE
ncbi:MAG: hypothetical protein WCD08_03020 [Steroidobacteraceae bacterium]